MSETRVPPLPLEQWAPGLFERTSLIIGGDYNAGANVYCTLANHPTMFEAWLHWGAHNLRRSSLDPRRREIVILRASARSDGTYPFAQHTRIGADAGMSADEVAAVAGDPDGAAWSDADRSLIHAVDALIEHGTMDDDAWRALSDHFDTEQVLDVIATTAFYRLASWTLNACGAALESGAADGLADRWRGRPDFGGQSDAVRLEPRPLGDWPADLIHETETWPRFAGRPELRNAGVYGTLANHPRLFSAIGPMMAHLLATNSLSDRHREVVIIRSTLRDRGEYPYRQHVRIGRAAGMSDEDLEQLATPSPAMPSDSDDLLVRVVDSLHTTNSVNDELWAAALGSFSVHQVLDAVATSGFYGLISFVLNTAGTPLEPGDVVLPEWVRVRGERSS